MDDVVTGSPEGDGVEQWLAECHDEAADYEAEVDGGDYPLSSSAEGAPTGEATRQDVCPGEDIPDDSMGDILGERTISRDFPSMNTFAVSQCYETLVHEDELLQLQQHCRDVGDTTAPAGALLVLPPIQMDSVMLRGDNGVCRWSTMLPNDATIEATTTSNGTTGSGKASFAQANVDAMLQDYYSRRVDQDRIRAMEERERQVRKRHREEEALKTALDTDRTSSTMTSSGDELWVSKYRPRAFKDLLSDEASNLRILQWMRAWTEYVFDGSSNNHSSNSSGKTSTSLTGVGSGGKKMVKHANKTESSLPADTIGPAVAATGPQRPSDRLLLIVGPPGVGKTTLAHVIALHCGFEAREINASSDRTISVIDRLIGDAVANIARPARGTLGGGDSEEHGPSSIHAAFKHLLRPKCLIIDEMDGIQSDVVGMLLKKDIHRPVLCLANNLYAPALRLLRSANVTTIHIPPITPQRLVHRLEYIVACEGMEVDRGNLSELVHVSNGDIRCCLNTLQFLRRSPGERVSAYEVKCALERMRGKDATLGLWPLWGDTFAKKERQRYISLLKSEFHLEWDAPTAAAGGGGGGGGEDVSTSGALGVLRKKKHRIDPGYVYMTNKVALCADMDTYLEGLFQHYSEQKYLDYTLEKTASCASAFAFHDVMTSEGYQHHNVGIADRFAVVTAGSCYSYCSNLNRGPPLTFPRERMTCRDNTLRGLETCRMFTNNLSSGLLSSMYLCSSTVALDCASLLTRSLIPSTIRIPSHAITSVKAFSITDQKLLTESVERHVTYGLTYAPSQDQGLDQHLPPWAKKDKIFALHPPLTSLGAVSSRGGVVSNSKTSIITVATKSDTKQSIIPLRGQNDGSSQSLPFLMTIKDEVRQLLAGECAAAEIRHHQEHFMTTVHRSGHAQANQLSEEDARKVKKNTDETKTASSKSKDPTETMSGMSPPAPTQALSTTVVVLPPPPVTTTPSKKGPVKRDFFGRPIPPKPEVLHSAAAAAAAPTDTMKPRPFVAGGIKAEPVKETALASSRRHLPPTHEVKYMFYDGSTNAVKMPASIQDFL